MNIFVETQFDVDSSRCFCFIVQTGKETDEKTPRQRNKHT